MINLLRAFGFLWGTCCLFFWGCECCGIGFQGHSNSIECVACSPDSRFAASGSRDGTIRIWEIESGRFVNVLEGHEVVHTVSWSPDGKWFLSSGIYDKVILWDFVAGKEKWRFCGKINSVQWSPDGAFFLLTHKENQGVSLKIFSVEALGKRPEEGLVQNILLEGGESVRASWSFDGRFIAAMVDEKKVVFFDTLREYSRFGSISPIAANGKNVFCQMKWSPTNHLLAVGDCCGNVLIWDAETDVLKTKLRGQFASMHLQWSSDGWTIASQGIHPDRSFWVWNVETGQNLDYEQYSVRDHIFTPEGFIRGKKYGKLGEIVQQKPFIRYRLSEFSNALAWSADGKYLLSGDGDYTLRIYRASDGQLVHELGNAFHRLEFKWGRFWGFEC